MSLWAKLSETAGVIVDVGANTGVYSLVAAAVNPAAQIFGFEPVAELFARYGRNCRLNGFNIRAYEAALSNTKGTGVMRGWVLERASAARSNSVAHVATYRLDEIAETAGIDELDLLKIDVEGHEPEVLEGMGMLLSKFRPTLLIEVLSDEAGAKLESLVGTLGYVYFDLDEIGPARLVPHVRASSRWNYLVCQPSVAEALGQLQN
jgi:FkbM family methyltransferase